MGIMGQVIHVGPMSSSAILITDASHSIPVQIDRTGLRANAFGTGKIDQLDLRHLPHNVDIQVGDMLISSGLGGTFPPNYPVANITKVERPDGEPFATVEATPMAQLDKSREVLLVWHNPPEIIPEQKDNAPEQSETNTDETTDSHPVEDNETGNDVAKEEDKPSTQRRGNRE
jgi:rod shape-determining protein MreC